MAAWCVTIGNFPTRTQYSIEANSVHMTCRLFLVTFFGCLLFLSGCSKKADTPNSQEKQFLTTRASVSLKLLVIDDAGMANAARLLRGEWAERSGGELQVATGGIAQLLSAEAASYDIVIFPSQRLAELVLSDKLRPVRKSVLNDRAYAFDDLLPSIRNEAMRFGGEVFALSLGEAPLVLASPGGDAADEAFAVESWSQLENAQRIGSSPVPELIARAISYADSQTRAELLFDPADFSPRIAAEPFVRALEDMKLQEPAAGESRQYKVLAVGGSASEDSPNWQFSAFPRAEESFDSLRGRWERTARAPPTMLGFGGRMVAVTTDTRNATSAFKLLRWLGSGRAARRLSSSSDQTVWFRKSQATRAESWLNSVDSKSAARLITEQLSSSEVFLLPRIPGIERYLEALEQAIGGALDGTVPSAEVLASVSAEWEELTKELGAERQRRSYRLHLGLDRWTE